MERIKGFICFFMISMIGLAACHHPPAHELIWQAEKVSRVSPDSADRMLGERIVASSLPDADRADYWYVRTLVHLRQRRGLVNDSLIAFSVDYYRRDSSLYHSSRFYNACKFAAWQDKWGRNDKRRQEELLLEALANTRLRKDSCCMEEAYSELADFYFGMGEYGKSIDANRNLAGFSDRTKAEAWYGIGLCYERMENDSARWYLSHAAHLAYETGSSQAYHFMRNYGDYLLSSDPKEAAGYFRYVEQLFPQRTHPYAFAEIFLRLGEKDSADYYLSELEKEAAENANTSDPCYLTIPIHRKVLRLAYQARFGLPFDFGTIGTYCDSISDVLFNKVQNEKERALMQQKLGEENLKIETSRQRMWVVLFAFLFCCTAVGSFLFFYIRNRRTKWLETEEKFETLQQLLREANANAPSENAGTVPSEDPGYAFFRKTLLQQLGMIRLVANTPTRQNQELLQQMARIANEDVPADSLLVWDDLYPVIDSVYDGFYTRLIRFAAGRLSEKEIQVCCLLCAGFSTKEIGVVTRQSVRTVYQRKTNIRHALEMDGKDDIVAFIDRVTA